MSVICRRPQSKRHTPLDSGDVVGRRFFVEQRIAMGAMGEVWAGRHLQTRERVAIKVLRADALANPEIVKRFEREAVLLARVNGDHVARVIEFFASTRHGPVLVMELIEGSTVLNLLRTRALSVEETAGLGVLLCVALRAMHAQNVVHRDVKPANVILRAPNGGARQAVFVDLGVSRIVRAHDPEVEEITSLDRAVGTVEYMAPEQILSSRDAMPSADLYAVGAIMFRAIAGRNVFGDLKGTSLARHKLVTDAPRLVTGRTDPYARRFEQIVGRALEMMPENRYATADDMIGALRSLEAWADRTSGVRLVSGLSRAG